MKRGGTTRPVIIVDVGLVSIFTLIVCKAHRHEKHVSTRGSGGMSPRKFRKITPEIESEGIFSNLSTFDVPADIGTENFLKCIICMPISMLGNVAEIIIFKIAMLLPVKVLLPSLMLV